MLEEPAGTNVVLVGNSSEELESTLLESYKPIDPVARGADYRKTGWQTFDEKAPPYRPSQAEIDRMRANWPN